MENLSAKRDDIINAINEEFEHMETIRLIELYFYLSAQAPEETSHKAQVSTLLRCFEAV